MTLNILNLSPYSSSLNSPGPFFYLPNVGVPSPSSRGTSPKLKRRTKPKIARISKAKDKGSDSKSSSAYPKDKK